MTIELWRFGEPVPPLAELVRRGGVLAIPTESSYGLAVDPRNTAAVERVYRIKGRERGMPLPVVIADADQLAGLGIDAGDPILQPWLRAADRLWPGPLSLVLPLSPSSPPSPAAAGSGSLAVRVPGHEPLRRLLAELGAPLTATSANASGEPPILDPEAVRSLLAAGGDLDRGDAVVIDGGRLPGGPPSTLVRVSPEGWEILRHGAVAASAIESAIASAAAGTADVPAAPDERIHRG